MNIVYLVYDKSVSTSQKTSWGSQQRQVSVLQQYSRNQPLLSI